MQPIYIFLHLFYISFTLFEYMAVYTCLPRNRISFKAVLLKEQTGPAALPSPPPSPRMMWRRGRPECVPETQQLHHDTSP